MAKPRIPMNMYVWDALPTLRDMTDGLVAVHAPDLQTAIDAAYKQFAEEFPRTADKLVAEMQQNPPRVFRGRGAVYVWGGRT